MALQGTTADTRLLATTLLESTAQHFDKRGDAVLLSDEYLYGPGEDLITSATTSYVAPLLPTVETGQTAYFLDLCCGTGRYSVWAAGLGYRVWGVDISTRSIEAAQKLARMHGVEPLCQFELAEAEEYLSSADRTFDVIFVSGSLYSLNIEKALPLISSRLSPGGMFLCVETNGSNRLMNLLRRVLNRIRKHRDPRTLTSLLKIADFFHIAGRFDASEVRFFDCLALASLLFSWNRHIARLVHRAGVTLDQFLLNVLQLRCFAFKVVVHGRKRCSPVGISPAVL